MLSESDNRMISLHVPRGDVEKLDHLAEKRRTSRGAIVREGILYILSKEKEV